MGAFLPDDDPHPLGPVGEVQQPGQLCHECPVADPVLGVVGGRPCLRLIETLQQVRSVRGQGEPDRVGQASPRQPGQEVFGAAGSIGAVQDFPRTPPGLAEQTRRELSERQASDGDVIGSGVRAGVAGPELDSQGFPGPFAAVVEERA